MTCSWFLSLKVGYWVFKLTTSSDPGLGYLLINLFLVPVMWNEGEGLCVDGGSVEDLLSQLEERKAAMAEREGTVSGGMR
jgi:hypothetical protein